MIESFTIVGTQVLVLFILIAIGFGLGKARIIDQNSVKSINDLMIYVVNPCVIVGAFQRKFEAVLLRGFLQAVVGALIGHVLCLVLALIIFKNREDGKRRVLKFAAIFSNCGFMGIPLLNALLGPDGVFYGAAYLAVFNILIWSYGQYTMAKGAKGFSTKKIILNPSIISLCIGLIFFFTSTLLPDIIKIPVDYLAALNTPVPMLIIGYTLTKFEPKDLLGGTDELIVYLIRLIVGPLALLGILYAMGLRGVILTAVIVCASAPVAALTTMFAIKYDCDEELSARIVSTSTLLSIITMTLIVGLTNYIA